jgi:hypothetical protein
MTQHTLFPKRPTCTDCRDALADFVIDGQPLCARCSWRRQYPNDELPDDDGPSLRHLVIRP